MRSAAEQFEIIGLMAAHESEIAELYRAYAERFAQCREFFLRLAAEEVEHARLISGLAGKVRTGEVHVGPGRFSATAILTSLDYVRERLQEAKERDLPLAAALATCRDLEWGLIEKRFFDIIEEDGPEIMELLRRLSDETAAHRASLDTAPCVTPEDNHAGESSAGR
jgi:hypothetical protein